MNINFAAATTPYITRAKLPPGDLLPLIPPGAPIAAASSVRPEQVGKIPGRFSGGAWWGLGGHWPTVGFSQADRAKAQSWPTANVGLRAADFPAVDCDVATEEARQMVADVLDRTLGFAPLRKRSNAPRALYAFRRTGEDAVRKMRVTFTDGVNEHAVEVLGAGQQYVINGIHPSGVAYEWAEGKELLHVTADGLTQVTAADLGRFMDALGDEITNRGWQVSDVTRARSGAQGIGVAVDQIEPLVDRDTALAALHAVPNNAETLPYREQIVGLVASFKACLGKQAEAARADVVEWATKHGWADEAYIEQVWESLTHVRVGPDLLFSTARKFGYHGDALIDFADPAPGMDQHIDAVQAEQDEEDQTMRALAAKVVYWPEPQRWIVLGTAEALSHAALNSYNGLGTMIAPAGASGPRAAANKLINSGLVRHVAGQTYLPAQPQLTTWTKDGTTALFYNRWRSEVLVLPQNVTDQDVAPWLDHAAYLVPNDTERYYLLDYFAHLVQRRGHKVRWAPVLVGNQGTGKDMLLRPIIKALGEANALEIPPDRLTERFNSIFERELLVVEEMVRMERAETYERVKALISGTASDTILIERKFETPYTIPNVLNFVFFSNHTDAISLATDDRRFFVVQSDAPAKSQDYYAALGDRFYKDQDGWRKVVAWLLKRDLSKFSADGRPMSTDAKQQMIEEQQPYYVMRLREELDNGCFAQRSVLTIFEVLDRSQSDFNLPPRVREQVKSQAQITRALKFCGWHRAPAQARVDGSVVRFWTRTEELAGCEGKLLKARLDAERSGKVSSIA